MSKLTDEEFEDKVIALREAFKVEYFKAIGGEKSLAADSNEDFMDAYSVGAYAGMSLLSTLAAVFMTRLVVEDGHTPEEANKIVSQIYHVFLHEILDEAALTMEGSLRYLKNLKNMN